MADCFVLYYQETDGKAEIIYSGTSKEKALDALLEFGKTTYCEIGRVQVYTQKEGL